MAYGAGSVAVTIEAHVRGHDAPPFTFGDCAPVQRRRQIKITNAHKKVDRAPSASHQLLLSLLHGLVDLVKVLDGEQLFLQLIDLDGSRKHFFQVEVSDLTALFDYIRALFMRADHAAAVNLDHPILPNQSKLNGVPKQAAQPFEDVGLFHPRANRSVVL